MRTTLTLDEDVAAGLRREAQRSGRPFKSIVNDLLRAALHLRRIPKSARQFKIRARSLGTRPGLDYDRISQVLDDIEGPQHR